ncbi:MAG: hypothetical protein LN414_08115, partial [Candidatus Thermoplasmatota archaeon]|nr:hypothetical protein [Candidatus Thermoplasmatota archaeon]
MSLKDLFDKEKGVLHKVEKRMTAAEEHQKTKGDRIAVQEYEKVLVYMDKNREVYVKLKPDISRQYTRLG